MKENTQFLTQAWYDKLAKELEELKQIKLPEVVQRLKEAIKEWDLSENAAYDDAMSQKDLIEVRINELENMLSDVEIVKETKKSKEVRYWSVVTLEDENWAQHKFTMVGSWEVDILWGSISFDSPVGHAITWKKKWDVVSVRSPRKRYNMKIVDIK